MRVLAVFEGKPEVFSWEGKEIKTSIFKYPVEALRSENNTLVGNQQANPKHHGGPFKEVYSYPVEAYEYWKRALSRCDADLGVLGENIVTESLDELKVLVGDRYQFGTMILEASQPRMPCFKLNLRLGRNDGGKLFLESPAAGIYWKIVKDGRVASGDVISKLPPRRKIPSISMKDLFSVMNNEGPSKELLRRVLEFPGMDPKILELVRSQL